MPEIMTPPIMGKDNNGDPTYTFTADHTLADVARWIFSEGGADEVADMLQDMIDDEEYRLRLIHTGQGNDGCQSLI